MIAWRLWAVIVLVSVMGMVCWLLSTARISDLWLEPQLWGLEICPMVVMLKIVVQSVGNYLLFLPSLALQSKHLYLSSLFMADLLQNVNGRKQVYFIVV
jgi:hypothetical protein